MSTYLHEHSTPEQLTSLISSLSQDDPQFCDRPENQALLIASRYVLDGSWHATQLRFFSIHEDGASRHVVIVEESEQQMTHIYIRHDVLHPDLTLLHRGLFQLFSLLRPSFDKHQKFLIECEEEISRMCILLASWESFAVNTSRSLRAFYMKNEQMLQLSKMEIGLPEGFSFASIDVEREGQFLFDTWSAKAESTIEIMKSRVRDLPSIGIRNEAGELVAWEFLSPYCGKFIHLWTQPAYRGLGLGTAVEMRLAQILVERGMRVLKNVRVDNVRVLEGTEKHALWSCWMKNDTEPLPWSVTHFRSYVKE